MALVSFKVPRADGDKIIITRKTDVIISIDKNVDIDSLKIRYFKWIGIDITNKIKKYLKDNTINLSGAAYDRGTHRFEISGKMKNGADFKEQLVIDVV